MACVLIPIGAANLPEGWSAVRHLELGSVFRPGLGPHRYSG